MSSPSAIEEANSELTLRLRQQELAAEFANFSLATDDLDPILHEACRTAARGMDCSLAVSAQPGAALRHPDSVLRMAA